MYGLVSHPDFLFHDYGRIFLYYRSLILYTPFPIPSFSKPLPHDTTHVTAQKTTQTPAHPLLAQIFFQPHISCHPNSVFTPKGLY